MCILDAFSGPDLVIYAKLIFVPRHMLRDEVSYEEAVRASDVDEIGQVDWRNGHNDHYACIADR